LTSRRSQSPRRHGVAARATSAASTAAARAAARRAIAGRSHASRQSEARLRDVPPLQLSGPCRVQLSGRGTGRAAWLRRRRMHRRIYWQLAASRAWTETTAGRGVPCPSLSRWARKQRHRVPSVQACPPPPTSSLPAPQSMLMPVSGSPTDPPRRTSHLQRYCPVPSAPRLRLFLSAAQRLDPRAPPSPTAREPRAVEHGERGFGLKLPQPTRPLARS